MVSIFEIAIYVAVLLISTLAGAVVLVGAALHPSVFGGLSDLSRTTWWSSAAGVGGILLLGVVLYRWPYMERKITFRQLKGMCIGLDTPLSSGRDRYGD